MMTVEQYRVYQITNAFVGKTWKNLSKEDKYLLGDWRADEKIFYKVGDEMTLYNETFFLKVKGWWNGDYYYPLENSVVERTTKKEQRNAFRRWGDVK